MPGISSTAPRYENGEMEYDHYQHYFYDDHDPDEDFFKSTAPSEDIWKKFELVPTPPMSPIRTVEGAGKVGPVHQSLGDRLELMSQFLGQDEEQDLPCKVNTVNDSFSNLSSVILQDCMWSGFSARLQAGGLLPLVDDEEDDEDEEEITGVMVEHQQQQHKSRLLVNSRQPVTITVCADHLDPCTKRFHISSHQKDHNYAKPSPDTLPATRPGHTGAW